MARYTSSGLLMGVGRAEEALQECKFAQELDPNEDNSGHCLFHGRDYDGAIAVHRLMLQRNLFTTVKVRQRFFPHGTADGAVVFSHSAHSNTGTSVDLQSLAFTLAHAGAAVVVPRRTLTWPPTDRSANREGAVVICAEHWLVDHTKLIPNGEPTVNQQNMVVREGFAYVGPRLCDPAIVSECKLTDPLVSEDCVLKHYCRHHHIWVPIGETEGGDSTPSFISNGGLGAVDFIQKELGLAPIKALMAAPTASGS